MIKQIGAAEDEEEDGAGGPAAVANAAVNMFGDGFSVPSDWEQPVVTIMVAVLSELGQVLLTLRDPAKAIVELERLVKHVIKADCVPDIGELRCVKVPTDRWFCEANVPILARTCRVLPTQSPNRPTAPLTPALPTTQAWRGGSNRQGTRGGSTEGLPSK